MESISAYALRNIDSLLSPLSGPFLVAVRRAVSVTTVPRRQGELGPQLFQYSDDLARP